MKTTIIYIRSYCWFILFTLTAVSLASCRKDDTNSLDFPDTPRAAVTLNILLPGPVTDTETAKTRAIDDNKISEVDVLLFGPNDGTYKGHYQGEELNSDPQNLSGYSFIIKNIPVDTYDMMVLANSRSQVIGAGLVPGMTRQQVRGAMLMEQTGKWPAAVEEFPFWGQLSNAKLSTGTTLDEIPMLRAPARIELTTNSTVQASFALRTVTVYHWQKSMSLIPDGIPGSNGALSSATDTGSGLSDATMTYSGANEVTTAGLVNPIYINETPNPGTNMFPALPCLVVGGEINGNMRYFRIDMHNTATGARYIDLVRNHRYFVSIEGINGNGHGTEDEAYKAEGAEIEARIAVWEEHELKNVEFVGPWWLEVQPRERTYPANSNLVVPNPLGRSLSDPWVENTVRIRTNQTAWTLDVPSAVWSDPTSTGWVTFSHTSWQQGDNEELVEVSLMQNTTGAERSVKIPVITENIISNLTIIQTEKDFFSILITDQNGMALSDITKYTGTRQQGELEFSVDWYPANLDCTVEYIPGTTPLSFEDGTGFPSTQVISRGGHTFNVKLTQFQYTDIRPDTTNINTGSPTPERSGKLRFTISPPGGTPVVEEINISHQYLYAYHRKPGAPYRADLINTNLGFQINSPGRIVDVIDDDNILASHYRQSLLNYTSSGHPNTTTFPSVQNAVRFIDFAYNTPDIDDKKAYAVFRFDEPGVEDHIFEIHATYLFPNCYMVQPGDGVDIPIIKAWRGWEREPLYIKLDEWDANAGPFECAVLWKDNPAMSVTANFVEPNPDKKSHIRVQTSGGIGNAVVAFLRGGKVRWSWHVWVTDYVPDNSKTLPVGVVMDRNIGAVTNNRGDDNTNLLSQGMMYQWGRKDPLPPVNQLRSDSTVRPFFPDNNRGIPVTGSFGVAEATGAIRDRVIFSIENPMTFMTAGQTFGGDWYGDSEVIARWIIMNSRNNPPFAGTIYETRSEWNPCPDGWNLGKLDQGRDGPSRELALWPFGIPNESNRGGLQYPDNPRMTVFFEPASEPGEPFGYYKSNEGGQFYPSAGYIDAETGNYMYAGLDMYVYYGSYSNVYPNTPQEHNEGAVVRYVRRYYTNWTFYNRSTSFLPMAAAAPTRCVRYRPGEDPGLP